MKMLTGNQKNQLEINDRRPSNLQNDENVSSSRSSNKATQVADEEIFQDEPSEQASPEEFSTSDTLSQTSTSDLSVFPFDSQRQVYEMYLASIQAELQDPTSPSGNPTFAPYHPQSARERGLPRRVNSFMMTISMSLIITILFSFFYLSWLSFTPGQSSPARDNMQGIAPSLQTETMLLTSTPTPITQPSPTPTISISPSPTNTPTTIVNTPIPTQQPQNPKISETSSFEGSMGPWILANASISFESNVTYDGEQALIATSNSRDSGPVLTYTNEVNKNVQLTAHIYQPTNDAIYAQWVVLSGSSSQSSARVALTSFGWSTIHFTSSFSSPSSLTIMIMMSGDGDNGTPNYFDAISINEV